MSRSRLHLFLLCALPLLLLACNSTAAPVGPPVVISSKSFTESYLLAEMYAQLLEANGIPVERQLEETQTRELHALMRGGLIDMYPEYTSTALLAILQEPPLQGEQTVYERVKRQYEQQFDIIWLERAPFNNTWALATTSEMASHHQLRTITDLASTAEQLKVGGDESFYDRQDGILGLEGIYGPMHFAQRVIVSEDERYSVLLSGEVDVIPAYGTDGQIAGHHLVLLEDDKAFWPPYNVAPIVRREIIERYPAIPSILNPLAPLLTQEAMTALNWQVDGPEERPYQDVARTFLIEHKLLPSSQP
ncbi:MAG: quaternary ammonium transporter [Ardenticatenales bacterium]|nr:quaternary ammonium transporter [Ardenticatenales bacterium]